MNSNILIEDKLLNIVNKIYEENDKLDYRTKAVCKRYKIIMEELDEGRAEVLGAEFRKILEIICKHLYSIYIGELQEDITIHKMISKLKRKKVLGQKYSQYFYSIKDLGNRAVHTQLDIDDLDSLDDIVNKDEIIRRLNDLVDIIYFYFRKIEINIDNTEFNQYEKDYEEYEIEINQETNDYNKCLELKSIQAWGNFIKKYPNSKYISESKRIYTDLLKEDKRAKELEKIKKLAESGNVIYIKKLADIYYYGTYGERNHNLAYSWYKVLADKNDLEGITTMAHMYTYGITVDVNFKKAFEYYKKGAMLGDTDCLVDMAFLLRRGNGVPQDINQAKELLKIAAKKGNKAAKSYLKRVYNIL
ncbi:MAG: DUF4145 domain-containing protein [Clostridium saudiense]|uniref:DUF4145 domain-containing protein n=1 Tax=Clostridium saudiense TaxID=1414720 RepID=UPI0029124DC7|nr:DUF4145 domain-containing protein [Clostridium saudiense]MDU3520902.1 DUF4145 domain-containing protein [Clostridium saudiense]